MNKNYKRASVIISGHVQGVFYRASTLEKANELNITGWVKNNSDQDRIHLVIDLEANDNVRDLFKGERIKC